MCWEVYIMKIISLIIGIICILVALLMLLIKSIGAGIVLLLLGLLNLFLYYRQKHKKPAQEHQTTDYVPEALQYDSHDFHVSGFDYYQDALSEFLEDENEDYKLPKSQFLEEVFERCYQYDVEYYPADLVDEPENEYDPNAIAVYVEGERIGYIAKRDQAAVKALDPDRIEAEIYGGKYKEPDDEEILTGSTPYKAMLHIYTKR